MRNSCVSRPAKRRLIIINEADLEFTGGNVCAAALISFFEYWHNIKLEASRKAQEENDVRESHGDSRTQNETLVQFHTAEDLESGLCGMYKKDAIRQSLNLLMELKVIEQFKNPNPRYSFDKTNHFLFHPETLNNWYGGDDATKPSLDERKSVDRSTENRQPLTENRQAIPNTTSNTTSADKEIYIHRSAVFQKTPVERIDKAPKAQQQIWFAQWWEIYWRKEAKIPAWKTFAKHIGSENRFGQLLEITRKLLPEMLSRPVEMRKTPAAWLNTEPWEDLGEASPPQQALALAAANGGPGARLSRKEQASIEFDERMMRELGLK